MKQIKYITQIQDMEKIEIGEKIVRIPYSDEIPEFTFVGQENIIEVALSAWSEIDGILPHHFRLYGPPGVGKNTIVYELSKNLKKDLYIINGHDELKPEDIACTAIATSKKTFEYVASPLFAAMLKGGICLFDEIEKAPPRSLAPLASVLDDRRTLTSVLAGIRIKAHSEFLFCAASNEDEDNGTSLPPFIDERTRPSFKVGYLPVSEIEAILKNEIPYSTEQWIQTFLDLFKDLKLSTRRSIEILEGGYKLYKKRNGTGKFNRKMAESCLKTIYKYDPQRNISSSCKRKPERERNVFTKLFVGSEETIH